MATRMQQRRGTAAEWTAANPVLAAGEIGYESDTGKFKFGDGINAWSSLTHFSDASALLGAAPESLDTLAELAAAVNDDPDFYTTVAANATAIAANAADIATANAAIAQNAADMIAGDETLEAQITAVDTSTTAAIAAGNLLNSTARDTLQANLEASIATVSGTASSALTLAGSADSKADTANTSIAAEIVNRSAAVASVTDAIGAVAADLVTEEGARAAGDSANATAISDEATARAAALSAHNSATLSVHGIADTSVLATTSDVSTAQTAAQTYADGLASNYDAAGSAATAQAAAEGHADGEIVAHAAVTTNVHGIADTSDLALLSAAAQTFDGDITIAGNFTVSGTTTTVSTQDLVVNDPMIYIGEGSTGNTADLGLVGSFDDGTYQHSGIVRDSSEGIWKLFKGVTDEPSTTINFGQGSLDDLAVNNLEAAGVVFTDGTQTKVGVPSITSISEKTASYTLSATTERDTIVEVNSSSATTLTIPTDATVDFPVGTTLDVIQTGTGQVTIAGAGGVTVNATPGLKLRAQWSSVTLLKRGANNWLVFGDTSA
jgi:hypothetical protein